MKALVTGGTGFLGQRLVRRLVSQGWDVRVLSRSSGFNAQFMEGEVEHFHGDLTLPASLKGVMQDVAVVFHLAAQLGEWEVPWENFLSTNVTGTRLLLDECKSAAIKRFVYVSTPGVQGKGHRRARESLPYNPPYAYEKSKCLAEKCVLSFHRKHGLPITIIRPDFVYGPGDYRRVPLYRAIKTGRFLMIGNGKSFLHPTYVDDAVSGTVLAATHPQAWGEIFNIAGPEQLAVSQYIKTICHCMGKKLPAVNIPKFSGWAAALCFETLAKLTDRAPYVSRSKVEFLTQNHGSDITKARRILNYRPRYGFRDGFQLTLDWLNANDLV